MKYEALATAIGSAVGTTLQPRPAGHVHGGSINESYRWEAEGGPLFVKTASAQSADMFAAEAAGLEELRAAEAVRVPRVLGHGESQGQAWLALEWIETGALSARTEFILGEQLARQHRCLRRDFGWRRNNTIGSTVQVNERRTDWVEFYRDCRLRIQLRLAASNGFAGRLQQRAEVLLMHLGAFFSFYHPVPSLLHGDLWSGNRAADERGNPVIFDPAVYYGDREADLAMTRLFGGFGANFYSAYESVWPLDAGARGRKDLYNLYHVLNHLNLFGGGYLGQAMSLTDGLLAEVGH
jgi:protein-ribulosamine 3-kinase